MLILFHYISILILKILQKRKHQKCLEKLDLNQEIETVSINSDLESSLKFDPPVYRQRYGAVYQTLIDERWRTKITKLCDFGCAEFGLFIFVKKLNRLNEIIFVDIDEDLIREYVRRVYPLTIEHLKRREEPLQVQVFAGSVADPDYRILNTDVVTAIELIEHLYPDVLEAFPYNIFNYAEPKIVILTTPNADFNVLFSSDLKRFRHYDHKFEWTREQFQDWANNIVIRFPDYTVSFSGIGEGPDGTEHLGCCSQMAVFVRKDILNEKYMLEKYLVPCSCPSDSICKGLHPSTMSCKCTCTFCSPSASYGICNHCSYSKQIIDYEIPEKEQNPNLNIFYKTIEKIEYPFEHDTRTEEEKLMNEFRYRINNFGQASSRFFVIERERSEIPLNDLLYGSDELCITESELANLLTKHDYQIERCIIPETNQLETCVIYAPLMDNITSSSEASDFETNSGYYQSVNESLSDWDDAQQVQKEEEACTSNRDAHTNGFPNWLLQILGTQVPMAEGPMEGTLEEPHYYCQGDGLGVHPSVMAVEVDDEDDEHSTESSNNSNTTDFAEIDPGISSQEMSSLPEDSAPNTMDIQDSIETEENGGQFAADTEANFDSASSSSDTGIGTSKSS